MKLHTLQWGSATNRRILLLHGMGGTGQLWRGLASGLEDHMSILAPDQRGHGKSRTENKLETLQSGSENNYYTPLQYGEDLVETLTEKSFFPTWVLGHSMGVRSSVALAHLKPDFVQGLILIDLGLSGPAGGGLGDNLAEFLKILPHEFKNRTDARTFMDQHCPDPSMGQYLMAVAQTNTGGKITFPFDHEALIATIWASSHISVRDWLMDFSKTKKPVYFLRGEKSLVWSKVDFEKEQKHFGNIKHFHFLEFKDATHGLPFEKRSELIAKILEWT